MSGLPQFIIVAGPNGAGKTTFAKALLPTLLDEYTFINADEISKLLKAGGLPGDLDRLAGRKMVNEVEQAVVLGQNVMIETTLSGSNWSRRIPNFRASGYRVSLFYLLLPSPDAAVSRVARRVAAGGHAIPEATIRRRYARSFENLTKLYRPIVDELYVFDSASDPPVLVESWSR